MRDKIVRLPLLILCCRSLLSVTLCFLASANKRIIHSLFLLLFFTSQGCSSSSQDTMDHLKHHAHRFHQSTSMKAARSHPPGIQLLLLFQDLNCLSQTLRGRRVKYQLSMLLFKGSHIITHFKANKFCTAQENELGVSCTVYKLAGSSVFSAFFVS